VLTYSLSIFYFRININTNSLENTPFNCKRFHNFAFQFTAIPHMTKKEPQMTQIKLIFTDFFLLKLIFRLKTEKNQR
jgi:hypothetical protein